MQNTIRTATPEEWARREQEHLARIRVMLRRAQQRAQQQPPDPPYRGAGLMSAGILPRRRGGL